MKYYETVAFVEPPPDLYRDLEFDRDISDRFNEKCLKHASRVLLGQPIIYRVAGFLFDACGVSNCGIWAERRPPLGSSQAALFIHCNMHVRLVFTHTHTHTQTHTRLTALFPGLPG